MAVGDHGSGCTLRMDFGCEAVGFMAKLFTGLLGRLMKGSMVKAIRRDLEDIKAEAERRARGGGGRAGHTASQTPGRKG